MKRKHFYMVLLICCLGMLSSANQTSSDCKKVVYCTEMKTECCSKTMKAEAAETSKTVQPLNLLLFEL